MHSLIVNTWYRFRGQGMTPDGAAEATARALGCDLDLVCSKLADYHRALGAGQNQER